MIHPESKRGAEFGGTNKFVNATLTLTPVQP